MLQSDDIQQVLDLIKQNVQFHKHLGIDSAQLDYNSLLNKPGATASAGLKLVSYNSTTGNNLTVSGLDLATDLTYKIVINMWTGVGAAADSLCLRFNNDATAAYGVTQMAYPAGNAFATGQTYYTLTGNNTFPVTTCEILVQYSGGILTLANGHTVCSNGLTTGTATPYVYDTGCTYFGSNVTSIKFFTSNFNTQAIQIWVYKLLTA